MLYYMSRVKVANILNCGIKFHVRYNPYDINIYLKVMREESDEAI